MAHLVGITSTGTPVKPVAGWRDDELVLSGSRGAYTRRPVAAAP